MPIQRDCLEDMFEYLQMLANVSWTTKLQEEIEYLDKNAPNMTKQIAEMLSLDNQTLLAEIFTEYQYASGQKDDFEHIFGGVVNKILLFTVLVFILTLNTTFHALLILFEKFGGDPMKRSLINQLIAEIAYANILANLIGAPILIFRIGIGPVHTQVVDIWMLFLNTLATWYVLYSCMTCWCFFLTLLF